jgi:hypothetical protein
MEDIQNSTDTVVDAKEPENTYEQMCISLYAYRYGALGFLDLLAKFEENLGIVSPQTKPYVTLE